LRMKGRGGGGGYIYSVKIGHVIVDEGKGIVTV
jgi:hypothetical protein